MGKPEKTFSATIVKTSSAKSSRCFLIVIFGFKKIVNLPY